MNVTKDLFFRFAEEEAIHNIKDAGWATSQCCLNLSIVRAGSQVLTGVQVSPTNIHLTKSLKAISILIDDNMVDCMG